MVKLPEAGRKKVLAWITEARVSSLQPAAPMMLSWPWNGDSAATRLLLR